MKIQGKQVCVLCDPDPYYPECVVFCGMENCKAFDCVSKRCEADRLRTERVS